MDSLFYYNMIMLTLQLDVFNFKLGYTDLIFLIITL